MKMLLEISSAKIAAIWSSFECVQMFIGSCSILTAIGMPFTYGPFY